LRFLVEPPRFLFFTGKGGVGKTSLACATAVSLADAGRRVLLVSTDPASNIGQVFDCAIGNRITPIPGVPTLSALEIDPQEAARDYRERTVASLRSQLAPEAIRRVEEQLSGACTIEVAAFDEFTALLTDPALDARFDHVIFDTAPTGHTIRLLQLPGAWDAFLEIRPEGASCVGPPGTLGRQHAQYAEAVRVLADAERTRLVLVSRAQPSALAEADRTREELAALGLDRQYLVINARMPESESADELAASIRRREQLALAGAQASLGALPQDQVALKPYNVVGLDAVRRFLSDSPDAPASAARMPSRPPVPVSDPWLDELAAPGKGLIILTGKGGVGKTTLAAAIAVELVARGHRVHLTTTDPAAHLHHALPAQVRGLTVTRVDPRAETERYRAEALAT
jgi:arsenite-transporting ATPase